MVHERVELRGEQQPRRRHVLGPLGLLARVDGRAHRQLAEASLQLDQPVARAPEQPECHRSQLAQPLHLSVCAAGLGASIALLCDIIVADEKAVIGDPHVKVGLVAGDGGALIWPQLVGYARAKEMLMTGDILSATEAKDMGLINHVVPTDELDAKVQEIVDKLQGNPRWAVRWTKTVTNIPLRALAAQVMDAAIGWESVSNFHEDRKEAVAAMRDKRKPKLTGE